MSPLSILSGTDLSTASRLAAQRAQKLARESGKRFVLAHVTPDFTPVASGTLIPEGWGTRLGARPSNEGQRALATAARGASGRLRSWIQRADIEPDATRVLVGTPHEALLAAARGNQARLIVTGVHRPGARAKTFLLGSTADRLLRKSSVPVLLVRRSAKAPYRTVIVALDLGDSSPLVVTAARDLAPDAILHLVHFVEKQSSKDPAAQKRLKSLHQALESLADAADVPEKRRTLSVVEGEPRQGILRAAVRRKADLIVVGTRARKGLERLLLGSIAEYVLRTAETDVLAVPPKK